MKQILIALLVLTTSTLRAQSTAAICTQHYCGPDSVFNPTNSLPLVGRVLSSVYPIQSSGWFFVSGPIVVNPPIGDSVWIALPVTGTYKFKYQVVDTKGNSYVGFDIVVVVPLTVLSTTINYVDGTSASSKQIKTVTVKYSDGTTKVFTITP